MKKITYLMLACVSSLALQAQTWTKLALPETGKTVTDLYEDVAGNLYALTNQGIFKSTNEGSTWSLMDRSMQGGEIMTVAPNGKIYVDEASAVLKYDGKKTTQVEWYRWATNNTTAAMVSLSDGKLIYSYLDAIKRKHKYYTSTDNGVTFTQNTAITNMLWKGVLQGQLMVKKNDDVFYLGSDKNLYKSTDKGVSYTAMGAAISHTGFEDGVCLDKEKGNFYAIWGSSNARDIHKSTDDGATWTKLNTSKLYGADRVVANNDIIVIYGSWTFLYSSDGGATWQDKKGMFESGNFPEKVLITSKGKVFGTNIKENAIMQLDMTNETKTIMTDGLDFTNAKGMSYNGKKLAGCLSGYAHYTSDNGTTWKMLKGEGAFAGNTYVAGNGKVYTASSKNGTWNGVYIQDVNDSMVAVSADVDQVWNMQSMFEDDKGNIYCLSNLYGLFKSADGMAFVKLPNAPFDNLNDMTMWFDAGQKRIYAIMHSLEEIHYSDDYGASWTKGTPLNTTVKIHFKGEGKMWVYAWSTNPAETGFYHSSDLINWNGPFQTATSFDGRWSQLIEGNSGNLYVARSDNAGTGYTVLSATDNGKTWSPYADGLDTVAGFAINGIQDKGVPYNQLIAAKDKLVLGTNGSVYMADHGSGPSSVEHISMMGLEVYPNPVGKNLHIKGLVDVGEIKVYNQMGQLVAEPIWNGQAIDFSLIPAGSYILEIKVGNQIGMQKIVVAR